MAYTFFIHLVVCWTVLWSASASGQTNGLQSHPNDDLASMVTVNECRGKENGTEGGFSSLGYPHPYANNTNCTWVITVRSGKAIKLMFQSPFDLESGHDFLKIYENSPDGNRIEKRSMTGNSTPSNYTSMTNRLEITMTTDANGTGQGFSLEWIETPLICGGLDPDHQKGVMIFPVKHGKYINCNWIMQVTRGSFIKFDFLSLYDPNYVRVYETSVSGVRHEVSLYRGKHNPPSYTSTTNRMEVTVVADGGNDISFMWKKVAKTCGGTTYNKQGSISSPGYPSYNSENDCTWTINAAAGRFIKLIFHGSFGLDSKRDYLRIFEYNPKTSGREEYAEYTGDSLPPIYTSVSDMVEIVFRPDGKGSGVGFNLSWEEVDHRCYHTLNAETGTITSPNYPTGYDVYTSCTWNIDVPKSRHVILTFHAPFDVLSGHDYVKINELSRYDVTYPKASYSGNVLPPPYVTTEKDVISVQILLTSRGKAGGQGFNLTWETVDKIPAHDHGNSATVRHLSLFAIPSLMLVIAGLNF